MPIAAHFSTPSWFSASGHGKWRCTPCGADFGRKVAQDPSWFAVWDIQINYMYVIYHTYFLKKLETPLKGSMLWEMTILCEFLLKVATRSIKIIHHLQETNWLGHQKVGKYQKCVWGLPRTLSSKAKQWKGGPSKWIWSLSSCLIWSSSTQFEPQIFCM